MSRITHDQASESARAMSITSPGNAQDYERVLAYIAQQRALPPSASNPTPLPAGWLTREELEDMRGTPESLTICHGEILDMALAALDLHAEVERLREAARGMVAALVRAAPDLPGNRIGDLNDAAYNLRAALAGNERAG